MKFTLLTSLAAALFSSAVGAQQLGRLTYTLPWTDGNTLIISVTTNALGQYVTQTLSTLGATGVTTALTSASSASSAVLNPANPLVTTTSSSSSRRATSTSVNTRTSTQQGQIAYDTTATDGPPMRTTTYWFDPGDGVWTVATWTASITAQPSAATATVPEGTIQEYNSYQSVVNSAVLSSAQAAQTLLANSSSAAGRRVHMGASEAPWGALAGWTAMFVGMAGMGYGVLAL